MASPARASDAGETARHGRGLRRDELRERLAFLGLSAPAVVLILVTMTLPVAWLFALSFLADDGSLSLVHYRQLSSAVVCADVRDDVRGEPAHHRDLHPAGRPAGLRAVAVAEARRANPCLIAVICRGWTSLLVRTYAWLVLLQR